MYTWITSSPNDSELKHISVENTTCVQKQAVIHKLRNISNISELFAKNSLVLQKRNDSEMTKRFRNSRTILKKTCSLS
jgi:hypothetical protein